jgi:hypothetical protein
VHGAGDGEGGDANTYIGGGHKTDSPHILSSAKGKYECKEVPENMKAKLGMSTRPNHEQYRRDDLAVVSESQAVVETATRVRQGYGRSCRHPVLEVLNNPVPPPSGELGAVHAQHVRDVHQHQPLDPRRGATLRQPAAAPPGQLHRRADQAQGPVPRQEAQHGPALLRLRGPAAQRRVPLKNTQPVGEGWSRACADPCFGADNLKSNQKHQEALKRQKHKDKREGVSSKVIEERFAVARKKGQLIGHPHAPKG